MSEITVESVLKLTPELLAKTFWAMDSGKQAEFFLHLSIEIEDRESDAEMQFLHMRDELRNLPPQATKAYRQLSVWAYDFVAHKNNYDLWQPINPINK